MTEGTDFFVEGFGDACGRCAAQEDVAFVGEFANLNGRDVEDGGVAVANIEYASILRDADDFEILQVGLDAEA